MQHIKSNLEPPVVFSIDWISVVYALNSHLMVFKDKDVLMQKKKGGGHGNGKTLWVGKEKTP